MHVIEIRERGMPPRRINLRGPVEVGRDCDGLLLEDVKVSRSHLRLEPSDGGVLVVDLGSTNGTWVQGARLTDRLVLGSGAEVRLGDTVLVIDPSSAPDDAAAMDTVGHSAATHAVQKPPESAAPAPTPLRSTPPPPPPPVAPPSAPARPPLRPALDELRSRETPAGVVRYRPGTTGEQLAGTVADQLRRARSRLTGFGSEPWGTQPQVCLVDPFEDPDHPGSVVASGSFVDAAREEIWMVVTSESPPEPLERSLALLFGASFAASEELAPLIEAYGLYVAGVRTDDQLRGIELPPLGSVPDELGLLMMVSFVGFLIERSSRETFARMLSTARPGGIDAAAQEAFGLPLGALEESWRVELARSGPRVKTGQFVRVSARYLRPHMRRQIEISVYMLLSLAFTMVFPFVSRRLFDSAIPSGKFSEVLGQLGILGIAFVVSVVAGVRRAFLSAYVSSAVIRDLRTSMFGTLQGLSPGWFAARQQGDVLSRLFQDVSIVEAGLSQTLREGVFQMLSLVVSAAIMLRLDPWLGLLVLAGAPAVALVYRGMSGGALRRSLRVQELTSNLLGVAAENYTAHPVVRSFSLEARERARFGRASERLFQAEKRLSVFGGFFGLSVNLVVTLLRLGVIALGAWRIVEGHMSIGTLVAFLAIMGEVLNPVTALTGLGQQIQQASGALLRVNEILEARPDVADTTDAVHLQPLRDAITLTKVTFAYSSDKVTLEDLSLTIPAGARVAFVGPSGAGKSSVLQLVMRNFDPQAGAVEFDGVDLRQASLVSLRSQLGVVAQDTFLFDSTIRENIALGKPNATEEEIVAAARAAELHEFIVSLPRGYDTLVGEGGGRLSGGQRQRVAIARALVRNPRVLVLDEATSALDPRTERQINNTLQQVSRGRTTIAVTHRLASVVDYDKIFVLVAGRLVESGTHQELLGRDGAYASLWAEQTGGAKPPAAVALDVVGALRRVPLFEGLSVEECNLVIERLNPVQLAAGAVLPEGDFLAIVARGRAAVVVPSVHGKVVAAELDAGDAFGVAAILGQGIGSELHARTALQLLVLDDTQVRTLAVQLPSVADALVVGSRRGVAAPVGGPRLSRLTIGLPSASKIALDSLPAPRAAAANVSLPPPVVR